MDEQERYDLICGPAFKDLKSGQDEMLEILRGDNGNPGLLHRVRKLESAYKAFIAGGVFILCAVVIQIVPDIVKWARGGSDENAKTHTEIEQSFRPDQR